MSDQIVFIDAETNDMIHDWSLPADHPRSPWLAELSMIFLLRTKIGWIECLPPFHAYFKPNSAWKMQIGAIEINGLTDAFLYQHGEPVELNALPRWKIALNDGFVPCAFNWNFDGKIMRGAMRRAGRLPYEGNYHDTMLDANKPVSARRGDGKRKWPTLIEACTYFGVPVATGEGPGKSVRDNTMQVALFREMEKRGIEIPLRPINKSAPKSKSAPQLPLFDGPDKEYKPPNPRSLAGMPAHRQPFKR